MTAIDGLNTLVKGQKLPIFSCAGLPAKEMAAAIVRNSRLSGGGAFVVVFVALGLPHHDYSSTTHHLEEAIHLFESVMAEMLEIAAFESRMKRLGDEIVRVTRRTKVL